MNNWIPGFKEIVTALIGVAVVAVGCSILFFTFTNGGHLVEAQVQDLQSGSKELLAHRITQADAAFQRQKDVMLYSLSLLGVVMGYYFGRMPAERRAESAEAAATRAQDTVKSSVQDAADARASTKVAESKAEGVQKQLASVKVDLTRIAPLLGSAAEPQRKTLSSTSDPAALDLLEAESRLRAIIEAI